MKQRNLLNIVLVIAAIAAFIFFQQKRARHQNVQPRQEQNTTRKKEPVPVTPADNPNRAEELNRRVSELRYSRHARCRMACRHIDESEVREILGRGEINYKKSETGSRDPKYAVEGITHDNQHVRIIFAQDETGTVVVTVIDLDTEWECDCR